MFWEKWHTGEDQHPIDLPNDFQLGDTLPPLLIVTDSLSSIMAVKKGPLAPSDYFEHRVWDLLLKIARYRRICLCFVYSHCGLDFQNRADAEAAAAAQEERELHEESDVWYKDAIRPSRTERLQKWIDNYKRGRARRVYRQPEDEDENENESDDENEAQDEEDEEDEDDEHDSEPWRLKARLPDEDEPLGPSPKLLNLPRQRAAAIYGMRVGCCPELGGAYHESPPELCPVCRVVTISRARRANEQGGVEHFLCCDAPAARRARHAAFENDGEAIPQYLLYQNGCADALLKYFDAFVDLRKPEQAAL